MDIKCETCKFESYSKDDGPCSDCGDGLNWESKPVIKDSGERREFQSGAVRDCAEGKGRCDLLPLDVVADYLAYWSEVAEDDRRTAESYIFCNLKLFEKSKDAKWLYEVLDDFCTMSYTGDFETMMLELSKHYENGAKKYAERNWEKGIPAHCYIDSAVRHFLKFMRGDTDEPHDRAFVWNIFGLIWTMKHKPECDDLPEMEKKEDD